MDDIERLAEERASWDEEFRFYYNAMQVDPDVDIDELEKEYHRIHDNNTTEQPKVTSIRREFSSGNIGTPRKRAVGESIEESTDVIEAVSEHFGTFDYPPKGKTFILPNGKFLDMHGLRTHSDVEQWLINNGMSEVKLAYMTDGSPTLAHLGCFRCNPIGSYCILPEVDFPTQEALNSLLLWLDTQSGKSGVVSIVPPRGKPVKYSFDEYITDDILGKVERYYTSGVLYEHQSGVGRACGVKYKRGKVGEKLSMESPDPEVRKQKEEEFRRACEEMDKNIDPSKRMQMRKPGERYKRGKVGEKLTIDHPEDK